MFWPRELRLLFGDAVTARVTTAASLATTCVYCQESLGNEDRSYLSVSSIAPRSVATALVSSLADSSELDFYYSNYGIAHARCVIPAVNVDADLSPPPPENDSVWRTGYTPDDHHPILIFQPTVGILGMNTTQDRTTMWLQFLLRLGYTLVQVEEQPLLDSIPVGTATLSADGLLDLRGGAEVLIEANLFDGGPACESWCDDVRELGRFLVWSGAGMHLPVEGEMDLSHAIERGELAQGWIQVVADHPEASGARC